MIVPFDKCQWCGAWGECRWSMDPIVRRCLSCFDEWLDWCAAA